MAKCIHCGKFIRKDESDLNVKHNCIKINTTGLYSSPKHGSWVKIPKYSRKVIEEMFSHLFKEKAISIPLIKTIETPTNTIYVNGDDGEFTFDIPYIIKEEKKDES